MPSLAEAGYCVVAPDLRGFGLSSAPAEKSAYSLKVVAGDMISLTQYLGYQRAIFIGHDWGAALVYRVALYYPQYVVAVAALSVAFLPIKEYYSLEQMASVYPSLEYQVYFNTDEAAKELNENIERSLLCILRSVDPADHIPGIKGMDKGKFLGGFVEKPSLSVMLTKDELDFYVKEYSRKGFGPTLNYYRNHLQNWEYESKTHLFIPHPCLFIAGDKDRTLKSIPTEGMEEFIPNLKRVVIKDCSHWITNEKPKELSAILLKWLRHLKDSKL